MAEVKANTSSPDTLKKQAFGLVIGLSLQFLLGMYADLFIQFPKNVHEEKLWQFAWTQFPIVAHILLGLALIFGASALLFKAIKQKNKPWIISSSIGAISILGAIITGARFVATQLDRLSYAMAVTFIIAMVAYCWGIYKSSN